GKLSVTNRPLRDVLPLLQRWYSLDVNVQDLKLLDRPVTVHAPIDSSAPALKGVEQSGGLQLVNDGKSMIFKDTSAAAKGKGRGKE
ncbi:MAG TPA: FecR domain-containing protein, partial [Gemmatimonadaceae bacterium]|nr:FecR domain-containing protein [Gemmatimonadaceae bacterium]